MGATEELLLNMEEPVATTASTGETKYFEVDGKLRTITVPESERLFGVEKDKDVERKYFRCPKIVGDNIDLSKHRIYISYVIAKDESGNLYPDKDGTPYLCDDVAVSGDYITFSWLLSGNVFEHPGYIAFAVVAKSGEGDALITRWNTTGSVGVVLKGVPSGERITEYYQDIINQMLERIEALESGSGAYQNGDEVSY